MAGNFLSIVACRCFIAKANIPRMPSLNVELSVSIHFSVRKVAEVLEHFAGFSDVNQLCFLMICGDTVMEWMKEFNGRSKRNSTGLSSELRSVSDFEMLVKVKYLPRKMVKIWNISLNKPYRKCSSQNLNLAMWAQIMIKMQFKIPCMATACAAHRHSVQWTDISRKYLSNTCLVIWLNKTY